MKSTCIALILLLTQVLLAAEPQGPSVSVELLSGTKQKAQFLGIQNDTVQLGGYINNKFTVVRIAKSKFKSIIDTSGTDLLLASPADSVQAASPDSITNVNDSAQVATNDTLQDDSPSATKLLELSSPTVLVSFEDEIGDSSLVLQINTLAARFLLESGEKIHILKKKDIPDCRDNICLQDTLSAKGATTIYFGRVAPVQKKDSLALQLTRVIFEEELPTIYKSELRISRSKAVTDALSKDNLKIFLLEAQGKDVSNLKEKKGYIYIDTDPEGATLSRAEDNALCRSPCTIPVTDTAAVTIHAFWNVDQHLWGGSTTIHPIMGDTVWRSIKLKRVNPELRIITNPAGAEIFSSKGEITKRSKTIGVTPARYPIMEPGLVQFKLRKFGFKDTLVAVYVPPISDVTVNVDLAQETDFKKIQSQQEWEKARKKIRLGHTMMGVSIAPIIVGALFTYLGQLDYDDAEDIKDDLNASATSGGDFYQKKVKENKDLVSDGDQKTIIGLTLIGTGVLVLGVGFFISF
ncbi:MAG: hypothetical protein II819_04010 [Fibrobacter sp.]|nr:hypothetical protein [Fibrobacter sp.]